MNIPLPDPVQWFDVLGICRCGKPATGTLRGPGNASYGTYCKRCADTRLVKAHKEREAYAKKLATPIDKGAANG